MRLRTVDKIEPPYPLGKFPRGMVLNVAANIVYLVHTRGEARLEGPDWERIFADSIGATWTPSNIGLDDVRLGTCCWGAKTVKSATPARATRVRLISGRNSLDYSFGESDPRQLRPQVVGARILDIWNARVAHVRERFSHCRTVVLLKSDDLSEIAVFEHETIRFEPKEYVWSWNKNRNLEGHDRSGEHRFTWQPHGSQFTIVERVPSDRIACRIRLPEPMSLERVLDQLGFDESWVELID